MTQPPAANAISSRFAPATLPFTCAAPPAGPAAHRALRSGVAFDILRRWLLAQGYDVALVRNVTDIDDKILTKAAENNRPWWEWVSTYEREFTKAYNTLGVLPPSVEPRATGFVTQMVDYMQRLIDAGFAYPPRAPSTSMSPPGPRPKDLITVRCPATR